MQHGATFLNPLRPASEQLVVAAEVGLRVALDDPDNGSWMVSLQNEEPDGAFCLVVLPRGRWIIFGGCWYFFFQPRFFASNDMVSDCFEMLVTCVLKGATSATVIVFLDIFGLMPLH